MIDESQSVYYVQEQDNTGRLVWQEGPFTDEESACLLADEVNRLRNYTTETYVVRTLRIWDTS